MKLNDMLLDMTVSIPQLIYIPLNEQPQNKVNIYVLYDIVFCIKHVLMFLLVRKQGEVVKVRTERAVSGLGHELMSL